VLNQTAALATGDVLCFLDSRCREASPDWLETLVGLALRPTIGAVGARMLLPDASVWHAGFVLDPIDVVKHTYRGAPAAYPGIRNRALLQQNVSAVSAACLVVRRSHFERLGGFDPASGGYFDVDFCLRLLDLGLRNIWTPHVTLTVDFPGIVADVPDRDAPYMRQRWHRRLTSDAAGNPNLAFERGLPVARYAVP
jgi:GT2 family glycosyltransferase